MQPALLGLAVALDYQRPLSVDFALRLTDEDQNLAHLSEHARPRFGRF